ncbi:excinuclease ABC subunit UvrA [Bacillus sp. FJAT-50079]|uniref:excinuclease ABC subunit UvrA n=1 Tax=Bacillus sp. FJAT-50079 TaxID=2833577 RepID=UPI001BC999F6|nr:excinuclease ABC subunit UvrA [Bacillus sp. FJAT-50079]MBS4210042.1 excinuclease ABC subunit UvrA [Bacillus sp. FJAT-50079]
MQNQIIIQGAREHNLKNISLQIPKHKLVVLTGPSGSGKSTLAMDILQRECQRQYMESSGMVTDSFSKPKVDAIVGLSPSISVGQHVTNRNPRSTVGTVTDMYTYLRLVYEKLGERPCENCQAMMKPALDASEAISSEVGYDQFLICEDCGYQSKILTRTHFSFNTPEGACETCEGLGNVVDVHIDAVFNQELSILDGAVSFWFEAYNQYQINILQAAAKHYGFEFDVNLPLKDYHQIQRDLLYYGVESDTFSAHFPDKQPPKSVGKGKFEGVITGMWRRYREKEGNSGEADFFYEQTCPDCHGQRLKKASRLVKVAGTAITDVSQYSLDGMLTWVKQVERELTGEARSFVETFLHDLATKLTRLIDVGLGYLSLDRQAITLSGGESQRLRLASILGSGLTGVLYILDEPTTGLHPKDTQGLVKVMKQLRDLGNTVLVIEHDLAVMKEADHIIDMGPGAGRLGGKVVGEGRLNDLKDQQESVTGAYIKEERRASPQRREGIGKHVTVHHANKHNLKNVTVSFPLGCFITVTGVSGSGKSTLLFDLVANGSKEKKHYDGCEKITGFEAIDRLITVNQSPMGRMKRSNIATYTEVFTMLRTLFAGLPQAKKNKLTAKHFSFNAAGGRCENCQGLGYVLVNMHFLPDLEVQCPVCRGKRFKDEVLEVTYKGYTISSLLDVSIEESLTLFKGKKKLEKIIELLCDVGLGYLQWGQSVTTLSGGEGQRLKLARELSKPTTGHTLYILDEPSTGLHPNDVKNLLVLLNKLVDAGNSMIVVEHNSEIIRESDWVIDMGLEGGVAGGMVVAEGTPEDISKSKSSYTGMFL